MGACESGSASQTVAVGGLCNPIVTAHSHPAIRFGGAANPADKKLLTLKKRRYHAPANPDIVAELLQLSD
jgi:hypothetical protein